MQKSAELCCTITPMSLEEPEIKKTRVDFLNSCINYDAGLLTIHQRVFVWGTFVL